MPGQDPSTGYRRQGQLLAFLSLSAAALLVLIGSACGGSGETEGSPPEGIQAYGNLSRDHVEGPISYPQTPPVGGPHSRTWQTCAFYSEPIADEYAVHSLEHGAVWITYRPDLPADQIDILRQLVDQTYVLVSPYPNLPAPVVATAWGQQLLLDSATDPRLNQFVSYFREGPQTPEPGAPCTGGTSVTF
jgi:hypothetical protein